MLADSVTTKLTLCGNFFNAVFLDALSALSLLPQPNAPVVIASAAFSALFQSKYRFPKQKAGDTSGLLDTI